MLVLKIGGKGVTQDKHQSWGFEMRAGVGGAREIVCATVGDDFRAVGSRCEVRPTDQREGGNVIFRLALQYRFLDYLGLLQAFSLFSVNCFATGAGV